MTTTDPYGYWKITPRRELADYLEAVGAGHAQNAADGTETAGTTRTSGETGTGGSETRRAA